MKVILPLRAEFGMKVFWHSPAVHAIEGEKVVYIEPGDEALYPSAQHVVVENQVDELRRNRYSRDKEFVQECWLNAKSLFGPEAEILQPGTDWPRKRFIPEPHVRVITATDYDVVVCPRRRLYGAEKNWPEWVHLTDWLMGSGLKVFAAGAPDSSYRVKCEKAWDHDRFLDATIAAMLASKLVVATDAGLAHLAVLCGAPLLMITYANGLVAPGPIVDETGKQFEDEYFRVKKERYEEANHTGSEVTMLPFSWYDPHKVFTEILRRLSP